MIRGAVWLADSSIAWSPSPAWREAGAREVVMELSGISDIRIAELSKHHRGVVVSLADGAEVWLLVGEPDPSRVVDLLRQIDVDKRRSTGDASWSGEE